jgi:signal transduction histidine kinase/response regulator RpfG family c-di-GMP phosphodiesterase
MSARNDWRDERVLVLMPTTRDAERAVALLSEVGVRSSVCADLAGICRELRVAAGAVLLTEEALLQDAVGQLAEALRDQPPWSAIPILVLAREGARDSGARSRLERFRNAIVVERPVRTRTLVSVVHSALRGRRQQHEIRDAIAARERQTAALLAHDASMRFALSAGKLGSWELELATQTLECSALFKAHYGRRAAESLSYLELRESVLPQDEARVLAALEHSLATAADYDQEHGIRWPDASEHWVLIRGRVAYDDAGKPVRMVGISLDVTDRKRMVAALQESREELARQANQLRAADLRKDEFLATLAHELRNPLAPIRTGLELLSVDPPVEVVARTQAVMRRQLRHMVRLIDDLLDVSRITRGKLGLKRTQVTLREVVDAAVEASRPLIEEGGHTLQVSLPEEPAWLDADLTRIAQVVSNLLNNSSKYTPHGGRIELSAHRDGSQIELEVRDNGRGIPPERLEDVFEMFSQVSRTLDRAAQGGLGIGLALVRRLVEMHGGTVRAWSGGPGTGSTFTVRLPEVARENAALPPESEQPRALLRQRILVVDDNEDAAELLSAMLQRAGHEVSTAADGPQALAEAAAIGPEVIILDIGMPAMSGYEVARALRQQPRFAETTLIALTGWGSKQDKGKALDAGFDHHLTKPVSMTELQRVLGLLADRAGDSRMGTGSPAAKSRGNGRAR